MFPAPIARLIREFQKLPGVGEKSATRFALHVLKKDPTEARALADALVDVKERIRPCSLCFQLTDTDPCQICASPRRDRRVLCVVEDQVSLLAVERSRCFFGLYHVLGGHLSPMEGVGPEHLKFEELNARIRDQGVEEVVLATNPDVEGDATALYVKRLVEPLGVRVTRIARGVPMGGDLEYTDSLTLGRALEGRSPY
jgi:recombination protein RecR